MVELGIATHCSTCGSHLSAEGRSAGLCPGCLLELALDDTSLEAELGLEDGEAPTLQFSSDLTFSEGQIQGERYRIRSLLGRGGMGEVWRAYDLKLRQDVALKALRTELIRNPEALETLRQEVRVAREVISPNVCRVYDLEELDGQELISMEYVDGTTLQEILRERGPLDLNEAREIASQFLAGLEAIHEAGLVHRDIKPENLMITRTGRVVVMDFGIAKGLGEDKGGFVAGTPAYMSPEQAKGRDLDARADLFSAGVVLAEMVEPSGIRNFENRRRVWEEIHQDTPRIAKTPWTKVITQAVAADREQRLATASSLARALEEVTLRAAGDETARPYPGLASFQEEDAEYFYGRELEVEALWKKLRRPHLLAVMGPSGAGKSSFLRAGLLPTLTDGWQALITTPGHRPFANLARALAEQLPQDPATVAALLRFEELAVAFDLVSQWRAGHRHGVIILDQFEELFTQSPDETRAAFAELLGALPLKADVHVLLSMRDDFLLQCSDLDSLAPLFSELSPLKSLSGASLRRAIVQPALKCGYRFADEAIVEEMLAEVEGERGALPMVAFAAAQLWEQRDRETGLLTREAYEQIGGVGGALAQHAEAALQSIGERRIPIVRELFRNLVTAQGTRAARDREELLSVFGDSQTAKAGTEAFHHKHRDDVEEGLVPSRTEVDPASTLPADSPSDPTAAESVLDTLIDARLLTSYEVPAADEEDTPHHRIEIVHESLLSSWPRLVRWQMQDAEGAKLRDELRSQASLWDEHGRSDDYLWTGAAYLDFLAWKQRYPGGLTTQEEAFTGAMTRHADRRKRRRRWVAALSFAALLAVLAVVGTLWRQSEEARADSEEARREAVAEARRAEAAKLLALAQLQSEDDPTEALAYNTVSLELADSYEARLLALRLLSEAPPALHLPLDGEGHTLVAFSPDGDRLAVGGVSEKVPVFSAEGGPPLILSGHRSSTGSQNVTRWMTNDRLLTSNPADSRARIWSLPSGEIALQLNESGPAYWGVRDDDLYTEVFDTDGSTGHEVFHLNRWLIPEGVREPLGTVDLTAIGSGFSIQSFIDLSGRGWIYLKGNGAFLRPLPVRDGVSDRRVATHDNKLRWVVTGDPRFALNNFWTQDTVTGELRQWDLSSPEMTPLRVIPPPSGLEEGADLSPPDASGRWVHSVTRQISLWKLNAWPGIRPLRLRSSGSWETPGVDFHPSGDLLVALTHGQSRLSFWPLVRPQPLVVDRYMLEWSYPALAFSPDGKWLAAVGLEPRSVRLWPLPGNSSQGVQTLTLPDAWQGFDRMVFDSQMRFLALVGGPNDWVEILPLDGSPPRRLEGFSDSSMTGAVALSPSGRRIASAPARHGPWTLRVWDLDTGDRRIFDLPESASSSAMGRARAVWSLAFSDESTLYSSGDGGVRRWDLESGTYETVRPTPPQYGSKLELAADGRTAIVGDVRLDEAVSRRVGVLKLVDLVTGEERELTAFGGVNRFPVLVIDSSGTVVVSSDNEGVIRVGRVSAEEPHLLLGHEGVVTHLAISPDGRWIASTGEDNTLRLWPVPDLDKPPLHTLPHDELIAKLKGLTNIRAVRDPESPEGWAFTLDPFPGWKEVPTWR